MRLLEPRYLSAEGGLFDRKFLSNNNLKSLSQYFTNWECKIQGHLCPVENTIGPLIDRALQLQHKCHYLT